jgi:predicted MFS family arabinose efflux permease
MLCNTTKIRNDIMRKLTSYEKRYNIFILLSVMATGLAEIYIPIVLYNAGFNLKLIFTYFIIKFGSILILYYPIILIGQKLGFKILLVISAFFLGISFYLLSIINTSFIIVIVTAISFSIFNQTYWSGRHYYAIKVLPTDRMGDSVGYTVITTQLALIPSAFFGALIIEHFGLKILTFIITAIALISIIPLLEIKEKIYKTGLNVKKVATSIPFSNIILMGFDQARQLAVIFFPLFIYLNVVKTYRYVGVVNVVIGIATMISVYFFARKIDREQKDYLSIFIILLSIVLFVKLNVTTSVPMLIVAIFEGLIARMHMTSIIRDIYSFGQKHHILSYLFIYEFVLNLVRVILFGIGLLLINNVVSFLYLCIFIFFFSSLFQFKLERKKINN